MNTLEIQSKLRELPRGEMLEIPCEVCGKSNFYARKFINHNLKRGSNFVCKTCWRKHVGRAKGHGTTTTFCSQCGKCVDRRNVDIKKTKKSFCSHSCRATHGNLNKTHGNRRSSVELYLEQQIRSHYPNLEISCNDKTIIGIELDFYFPELRLGLEINGILHYEPIYGQDKFNRIQALDQQKMLKCFEQGIELAVLNISECKKFTQKYQDDYWRVIKEVLDKVILRRG